MPYNQWALARLFLHSFKNIIFMKTFLVFALALASTSFVQAQLNPVKWSYEAVKVADGVYDLTFTAHIQDGWYVYSQYLESDEGPVPTSFHFEENDKVTFEGKTEESGHRHEGYDDLFMMNIVKFSGEPKFTQRVKLKGSTTLRGFLEFMTCDNERCLPPSEVPFQFSLEK